MSNLSVANIVNPITADTTPTENLSKQVCKAWVNFDGTGVPTIRDSYNVASITDFGTGTYGVTFSSAMPDVNYSTVAEADGTGGAAMKITTCSQQGQTAFVLRVTSYTSTASDASVISALVFSS